MMLGPKARVAVPAQREGQWQRRRCFCSSMVSRAASDPPIYGSSVGGSRLTPSTQTSSSSPVSGL